MTLIEHLTLVEETRSDINRKHDLVDVMFLVISAIMAGAEGWRDIQTFGEAKADWLQLYRPFSHGGCGGEHGPISAFRDEHPHPESMWCAKPAKQVEKSGLG